MIEAKIIELLPISAARSFVIFKLIVIDADIPLLLGKEAAKKFKVTLDFPKNLVMTPEKKFKLTRLNVEHLLWRVEVDQQKLHMKQRNNREGKIYGAQKICYRLLTKKD